MEEISIDPPIISNFTENYPVNEEEDKRIEVEEEELITSPFIEEAPPVEEPKKSVEKIVESLEGKHKHLLCNFQM